jgi:tRNA pseudouridine38-40 synthase
MGKPHFRGCNASFDALLNSFTFAIHIILSMDLWRYFIRLAYDGTRFHGWQRQPNGTTVQQTLEEALTMMMRTPVLLTGAGRTDTGVHASEFYAHFDIRILFTRDELGKLVFRLNAYLAGDIALYDIFRVNPDAHTRFSAVSRTYRYCVARIPDPFRRAYTHYIYGYIDTEMMNRGAALLLDYSDFTSFSKVDTDTATNICRISHARWEQEGSELVFTITADRFLRNMVRAIVGTLLQLGTGKISLDELRQIIESKDRSNAGDSAVATGLTLSKIVYPEGILPD